MSDLQATIEVQVELHKFYNVDLFQRGYYQVRTSLRTPPKSPVKVELSLPRNSDCNLVFPASIMNGVAVSKTFQILYRNEDVTVNDVILFKVHTLVDAQKIEESIDNLDLQLGLDLWFTDDEFGPSLFDGRPEQQDKLQCISQRTLKLHLKTTKGIHHHVPVLFDYFHLSTVSVTVHASLVTIHQTYMSLKPDLTTKPGWNKTASNATLESVLFGSRPSITTNNRYTVSPRLQQACLVYKHICQVLLSAYESLQASYESLTAKLPPYQQIRIEHIDCHAKLNRLFQRIQSLENEEDLLQIATADVAQLAAENVILWSQFLEMATLSDKVTYHLAKDHHNQRVKRFAEAFYTYDFPKQSALACYEPTIHSHTDLCTLVKNSSYFQGLLPLDMECWDIDGDHTTLPIIFEDVYCEAPVGKTLTTTSQETESFLGDSGIECSNPSMADVGLTRKGSKASDTSSIHSGDSASPRSRRHKLKFIKNIKPDTFKRPSSFINESHGRSQIKNSVAFEQEGCSLVGYRKINTSTSIPIMQLGTMSPEDSNAILEENGPTKTALYNAVSMPTLIAKGHAHLVNSGSMPELCTSASLHGNAPPDIVAIAQAGVTSGSDPSLAGESAATTGGRDKAYTVSGNIDSQRTPIFNGLEKPRDSRSASESPSDSSNQNIENGYVSSNSEQDNTSTRGQDGVDYPSLADTLTKALGEPEQQTSGDKQGKQKNVDNVESHSISSENKDENVESKCENVDKEHAAGNESDTERTSGENEPMTQSTNTVTTSNSKAHTEVTQSCDPPESSSKLSSDSESNPPSSDVRTGSGGSPSNDSPAAISQTSPDSNPSCTAQEKQQNPSVINGAASLDSQISQDSDSGGMVTVMELLRDEFDKSEKRKAAKRLEANSSRTDTTVLGSNISLRDVRLSEDHSSSCPDVTSGSSRGSSLGVASLSKLKAITTQPQSTSFSSIVSSSSTPELSSAKKDKEQKLVSPVGDSTINFITAKETLRRNMRYSGHIYSDFPTQASTIPYYHPLDRPRGIDNEGIHLIVCVHGLDGNSADLRLVRTYLELCMPGGRYDFLMSEKNQPDTFADFDVMTDRLVTEIQYHIEMFSLNPTRISFIGHSLGNLIIRSALSKPEMAPLLPKLHTFLSLSGPHLGTLYNSSGLVNMGMWFMQKWKKSGSLLQLSMKDHTDPRQTFLYKLSQKPGMEFFKNVLLVGSVQDRYVPFHSSRIELCKAAMKDSSGMGGVYAEMVSNILQPIIYRAETTFIRFDVFHALPNTANSLIGRAAHIAVLDSELFIEKFITVSALKYFK